MIEPARAAAVALIALAASGCDGDRVRVRVERAGTGAELLAVDADVAETAEQRARGLRDREPLAPGEGLLIELPHATEVCIVNDGVSFAIDAVYADGAGDVVAVEAAIAAGDATARCHEGVLHVLETAAGVAADVAPGDRLVVDR